MAVGELKQSLREIVLAVVDQDVRPELAAGVELLLRAGGNRHSGARVLGELDRSRADAAAATADQQRFALREAGALEDVGVHGAYRLRQRGGVDESRRLRHGQELARGNRDLLGVTAAGQQGADL